MITRMATHVIGDVHGCYRELCDLLATLGPGDDDRLIFVGDLVIRGPENASVVRLFTDDALPNATVILGNNEEKLRPTLAGDPTYANAAVLGTIDQLREAGLLDAALDLFDSFPLYVDLGEHWIVHAGVRPGIPLAEQDRDDLLKLKTLDGDPCSPMWWEQYDGPNRVIFGHHVTRAPMVLPYAVNLDTGCVYGGSLTAYTIETGTITSVRARETYYRHPAKYYLFE
jgi:serine/threonine protein phosphatase 1